MTGVQTCALPILSVVKGCGDSVVNAIVEERELNGDFESFEDFVYRTPSNVVKSNVILNLICVGAFSSMGYTVKTLWDACNGSDYIKKIRNDNGSLFSGKKGLPKGGSEVPIEEKQEDEEYLMGFVITMTQAEIDKRNRRIVRKVAKYRDYVYKVATRNKTSSGRSLKMKQKGTSSNRGEQLKQKMSKSTDTDENVEEADFTEAITELFLEVSTSETKLLSKIFVCVNKYNKDDKFPKTYHVNFVSSSKDSNEYKLDTKLMINAKCYVQLKKLLGDKRLWME